MGITASFSYNAEFKDIPNGYSYVGPARNVLTKAPTRTGSRPPRRKSGPAQGFR